MFQPKFLDIHSTVLSFFSLLFSSLDSSGQQTPLTYEDTVVLIDILKRGKNITPEAVQNTISDIIQGLTDNEYRSHGLKRRLLEHTSKKTVYAWAAAAHPTEEELLLLLYHTRQSVPWYLTDRDLKATVKGQGSALKKRIARMWNDKSITENQLNVLEHYPPPVAIVLARVISEPWLTSDSDFPDSIGGTWAANSLKDAESAISLVEFARRSTIAKLLIRDEFIMVPGWSVDVEFRWSGWSSITIYLPKVTWTQKDMSNLERFLENPYYGATAQKQLDRFRAAIRLSVKRISSKELKLTVTAPTGFSFVLESSSDIDFLRDATIAEFPIESMGVSGIQEYIITPTRAMRFFRVRLIAPG